MKQTLLVMALCLAFFSACNKADDSSVIDLRIDYSVNDGPLVCDTLRYVNEAGNRFMITEVQWFISRLELQNEKGEWVAFSEGDNIYYMDTDLPTTHLLHSKALPAGNYQALRFTFGLDEEDNRTGRFPNPPESNMFWPEPLGGGYHYMKLNCKWLDGDGNLAPVNIHLGVGQNESFTEFYPNHFSASLPIDLDLHADQQAEIQLTMVIDNWFRHPHVYDFNTDGTAIMQNQTAQTKLRENGTDVFIINATEKKKPLNEDMKPLSDISNQIMKMAAPKPHFMTWESLKNTFSNLNTKDRS